VTLTFLNPTGAVGPGFRVFVVSSAAGVIPADHYVRVSVQDTASGGIFLFGEGYQSSSHTFQIVIGKSVATPQQPGLDMPFSFPDGQAISLLAIEYDAGGSAIDSSAITPGYLYDKLSGLSFFFFDGTTTGSFGDVLAAVRRVFTPTQP